MKSIIHYISTLCIVLTFVSCGKDSTENKDHLVFRYNESSNITSLDPAFSKVQSNIWACNHIFNGLLQLDEKLNIQPDIAKSWAISPDDHEICLSST